MGLKKRIFPHQYKNTITTYNETDKNNISHFTDEETTFNLKPITLEDVDRAVWNTFNKKIYCNNKYLDLITLDAELVALKYENPIGQNTDNQFLNFPYFLYTRTETSPYKSRISPQNKPVIYSVPKQKAQGVVYEDWICPPPQWLKLTYTFIFISSYREHLNSFETYMIEYFKNKRNVIDLSGERFEIFPETDTLASVNVESREGSQGQTLYKATYTLFVTCYLRDINQIQKKERPNILTLNITEKSGKQLDQGFNLKTDRPKDKLLPGYEDEK